MVDLLLGTQDMTLQVIDKADKRPKQKWVPQTHKKKLFGLRKGESIDKEGTISSAVALIHEVGHAMQYFTCEQGLLTGQTAKTYRD